MIAEFIAVTKRCLYPRVLNFDPEELRTFIFFSLPVDFSKSYHPRTTTARLNVTHTGLRDEFLLLK